MNTVATTHEAPGTIPLDTPSTVLTPRGAEQSGGGRMSLSEPAEKPASIESVLEKELAEIRGKESDAKATEAKPEGDKDKAPEKEAKPEAEDKPAKPRAEDGKFAKAEKADDAPAAKDDKGEPAKAAQQEASERRPSEGQHREPPARFLPEARTKWANVPNEVKAEFHRVSAEMERESAAYKDSHERYAQIREFDELARSNGSSLRDSLIKVNQVENALQRNPIDGLDAVLREIGPRKSDGSPLTIMDVANYLSQNPGAYQPGRAAMPAMPQPQQAAGNPEIEALRAEILNLRAEQTVVPVIQRFADALPDFDALQGRIEQILTTGVIDQLYGAGLSLEQKLSEAYRMAGGRGPSSRSDAEALPTDSSAPPPRPVNPDAGTKSVRGAPPGGFDPSTEDTDTDIESILRKEMRRMRS